MVRRNRTGRNGKYAGRCNKRSICAENFFDLCFDFRFERSLGNFQFQRDSCFFVGRSQRVHHTGIERTDFIGRIGGNKNTMVFQNQQGRFFTASRFVRLNPFADFHAERIAGINVLNPQRIRKHRLAGRLAAFGTGQPVDGARMGVHHKLRFKNIMQRSLDRRTSGIAGLNGSGHHIFHQLLTGGGFLRCCDSVQLVDLRAVHRHKGFFGQPGQCGTGRFHPQRGIIFDRRIAAPAFDIINGPEFVRQLNNGF